MKFLRSHTCARWWFPAAGWLLAAGLQCVSAQTATLKKALDSQNPPQSEAVEKPEDARARLEQWLKDARDTLTRLENPTLPAGVSNDELEERRHSLERMVLTATRSLKTLTAITDARKDLEASRTADAEWSGFKERPPYSLLMIDELLNERDAIKANLSSHESSLSNYERLLTGIISESKTSESAVSNAILAVKNAGDDDAPAAKWRLEAAREYSRLLAARAGLNQSSCASLKDRIAAARIELALLDRKVTLARSDCRFNDEDLAKVSKISDERKKALHKESEGVLKRLKAAMAARIQVQAALDTLAAAPGGSGNPPAGLDLAGFRLEVAEGRVDAMQALVEGLESLIQLENIICKSYQNRRAFISAANAVDKRKSLAALSDSSDRLQAWENVLTNDMAAGNADLSKLDSRAASVSPDDPQFNLINDQRAARSEKLTMLQRLFQAVGAQRKLVKRWVAEYAPKPVEKSWTEKAAALGTTAWEVVGKIWALELMTYEDKVVVDGQTIKGRIPFTVGMLLRAILFFLIGYWVISRIANRIQNGAVRHGHVAEAQARTLRNWAMIVIGFFLIIGTLAFLRIPLTVFAFLGGALAIGLGIGTQTLIKNFISGIIVLAERKVRVGDVVEMDGFIGRVTEINTRSSVILSADDMETMVPNSLFLENRVTNWTLTSGKVRCVLRVGVAYGSPTQKVVEVLTESAGRHGLISKEPAPFTIFEDFGESALIFGLYYWLDVSGAINRVVVASDLRFMIEKRFTELDIGVPFPHRELRLSAINPLPVHWAKMPDENPP